MVVQHNPELSKQKINAILHVLDDLIESEPWDESNFIRAIGKNLRDIRDEFINELKLTTEVTNKTQQTTHQLALRSGQQEIFIGLYSSEGINLASWERIISNLPRQVISRPIYAEENDVKNIIKAKENKMNEAYVSVFVNPTDLLSLAEDKIPVDKFGKPLLTLKDKTLNLDNINFFVHESGIYTYNHGRLVKK